MPQRLRGYARHYLHYNRGYGQLESQAATERGYRGALSDWPGNALFWSRLVRVVCFQDRPATALADLEAAQDAVGDHPQKQTVLVARTVRGLLDKDRLVDAVRIWGDYSADTPYAMEVEQRLHTALEAGWQIRRLVLDPEQPLVFVRPVEVRVARGGERWSAEFRGLRAFGYGQTPLEALQALVRTAREEVAALVRAYTSDLAAGDRLRKRLLLGVVDVRASAIDASPLDSYWYCGFLVRDREGAIWFRTAGERDLWFEVPSGLGIDVLEPQPRSTGDSLFGLLFEPDLKPVVVDELPHLARVATDAQGAPTGPVIELRPGFRGSEEELWEEWRRLVADAG